MVARECYDDAFGNVIQGVAPFRVGRYVKQSDWESSVLWEPDLDSVRNTKGVGVCRRWKGVGRRLLELGSKLVDLALSVRTNTVKRVCSVRIC